MRFQTSGYSEEQVIFEIQKLYREAVIRLGQKLEDKVIWSVSSRALYKAVKLLEPYSISSVPKSIRDFSFWKVFSGYFKADNGLFITPEYLAELMVYLVKPSVSDKVIDPACGSGLLLLEAIRSAGMRNLFKGQDSNKASPNLPMNFIGLESNALIAELAETNFAISRVNPQQIHTTNSLDINGLGNHGVNLESFDIVIMDPPMGGKITDEHILKYFELSKRTPRTEVLFLELAIRLLVDNGRLVTLLPDVFLASPAFKYARKWLLKQGSIKAIISLPVDTFSLGGHLGKTSILLFEKMDKSVEVSTSVMVVDVLSTGYDQFGFRTRDNNIPVLRDLISQFLDTGTSESSIETNGLHLWVLNSKELSAERLDVTYLTPGGSSSIQTLLHGQFPAVKLADVVEIISGSKFKQVTESNDKFAFLVQASSVREMELLLEENPYISEEDYLSSKRVQIREGDVLVTSIGQYLGRAAIVESLDTKAVANTSITILRPSKEINPIFLAAFINSDFGREQVNRRKTTTTAQPFIRHSDLGEILIPLPTLDKQINIAKRIKELILQSRKLAKQSRVLYEKAKNLIINEITGENENE
jgi:type I restriction enzyme M protein